jgi:hypothetical protein
MRKLLSLRRVVVMAVLVGLAAVTAVVGSATVASASTPGLFTICSEGGYASNAVFPDRGGFSTFAIPDGSCRSMDMGGSQNEQVDVYKNGDQYLGSTIYNGSVGLVVVTISGPTYYAYVP